MILNGRQLTEILALNDLYTDYGGHKRLKVFVKKGRKCIICDREGVLLLVTVGTSGDRHVDLYTDDFVLMTVDHTLPKSIARKLGWTKSEIEALDNKQPMCEPCNRGKGNKTISDEEYREQRQKHGRPKRAEGVEVIRKLVYNQGIFNRSLS